MDSAYHKDSGIGTYSLDKYLSSTYRVLETGAQDNVLTLGVYIPGLE